MTRMSAFLALAVAMLAVAWPGAAQQPTGNPPQPARQPRLPMAEAAEEPVLNLEFPGGNAAEYVAAIRKAVSDVNVVVMLDGTKIPVPPVSLKNVDVYSALKVVENVPPQQPDRHIEVSLDREHPQTNGRLPVYIITGRIVEAGGGTGDQESVVIDISELLEEQIKSEDVLTAIESSLELMEGFASAQIRFHKDSGLLIVRGHKEQVSNIVDVVGELREKAERSLRAKERAHATQNQQAEIHGLRQKAHEADSLRHEAMEWKTRAGALENQVRGLEQEIAERRAIIDDLRAELHEAKTSGVEPGKKP